MTQIAHSSASSIPNVLRRVPPKPAPSGSGSKVRSKTAQNMVNTAQPRICTQVGTSGVTIHQAVPSSKTPKNFLTPSIQAPVLGISLPAEAPMRSNGTPIPQAMENSAAPPSTTSPVCEM